MFTRVFSNVTLFSTGDVQCGVGKQLDTITCDYFFAIFSPVGGIFYVKKYQTLEIQKGVGRIFSGKIVSKIRDVYRLNLDSNVSRTLFNNIK